eukprot:5315062-Pyramimonas_sp.AAC.1
MLAGLIAQVKLILEQDVKVYKRELSNSAFVVLKGRVSQEQLMLSARDLIKAHTRASQWISASIVLGYLGKDLHDSPFKMHA